MQKQAKQKLTKAEKQRRRQEKRNKTKQEIKAHPFLFALNVLLRGLVIAVLVLQFFNGEYMDVFLCALTLVLFMIPSFVERRLHIDVPNTLEVIILLFIFSAEILGEIQEYYLIFPFWDTMLHTINGFLMAAIGIAMVDILNRSPKAKVRLSPIFVALVAFCFSMTIGVLWEFFEYFSDCFFHTDMQKDAVIDAVTSVMLNPEGRNSAVTVPIESIVINGTPWDGYIDIGLHDTMKDLLVNFIGAVVFSAIGMVYIMGRGKGKFASRFIPRLKEQELPPPDETKASLLRPIPLRRDTAADTAPCPDCALCQKAVGITPCRKLYEDDTALAYLEEDGAITVIPKHHTASLIDCDEETAAHLITTVKKLSAHYVSHCGFTDVAFTVAGSHHDGSDTDHLHIRLVPIPAIDTSLPLEQLQAKLTLIEPVARD